MSTPLTASEIAARVATLPAWQAAGGTLTRTIVCASFPDAIACIVQIGFLAEAAAHHPDINIRWRTLTLRLTTYDAGGITERDIALAAQIDAIAQ